MELLHKVREVDIGDRLPSMFFWAAVFLVHLIVQVTACLLRIEASMHFVFLVILDFNWWRWQCGSVREGIQNGDMENWVYFPRLGKLEFEDNCGESAGISGRVP